MLLAWMPAVPLIFYYLINLKGFSEQKATGLGAAGVLAEVYLTFGLGLLRSGRDRPSARRILQGTLGACLIFRSLHLFEWTGDLPLLSFPVFVFRPAAPYILSPEGRHTLKTSRRKGIAYTYYLRAPNKTGKGLPILALLTHRHDACGRKSAVWRGIRVVRFP